MEASHLNQRVSPACCNQRKPACGNKDPEQLEINKQFFKKKRKRKHGNYFQRMRGQIENMKRKGDADKALFWAQEGGNRVGSFTFADIYLICLFLYIYIVHNHFK